MKKQKKLIKKLSLNKETLAQLDKTELQQIKGGIRKGASQINNGCTIMDTQMR